MTDTLVTKEPSRSKRRRVRRGGRWRSVVLLGIFVMTGFAVTGVLPVGEYLDRGQDVAAAQETLDQLVEENAVLLSDIEALYTDEEIERFAREQYGFVRDGEIGYVITPPEDSDSSAVVPAATEPKPVVPVEGRSFLDRIWDFVTGNDQTNDG